jgi:hypothetical protein
MKMLVKPHKYQYVEAQEQIKHMESLIVMENQ